jgi:hypothetical protein
MTAKATGVFTHALRDEGAVSLGGLLPETSAGSIAVPPPQGLRTPHPPVVARYPSPVVPIRRGCCVIPKACAIGTERCHSEFRRGRERAAERRILPSPTRVIPAQTGLRNSLRRSAPARPRTFPVGAGLCPGPRQYASVHEWDLNRDYAQRAWEPRLWSAGARSRFPRWRLAATTSPAPAAGASAREQSGGKPPHSKSCA